jgi:hypothetical protein
MLEIIGIDGRIAVKKKPCLRRMMSASAGFPVRKAQPGWMPNCAT